MSEDADKQVLTWPPLAIPPRWATGSRPDSATVLWLRQQAEAISDSLVGQRVRLQATPATASKLQVLLYEEVLVLATQIAERLRDMRYPPDLTIWIDQGRDAADKLCTEIERLVQRLQRLSVLPIDSDSFDDCVHMSLNSYSRLIRRAQTLRTLCDEYLKSLPQINYEDQGSSEWEAGWQSCLSYVAQLIEQYLGKVDRDCPEQIGLVIEMLSSLPETLHSLVIHSTAVGNLDSRIARTDRSELRVLARGSRLS
jgi:hypothetical protein